MGRTVPAVGRALDILELLLDTPAMSAAEIVKSLALPRTTVHELVNTLTLRGYLQQLTGQPVSYALGYKVFQLGSAFSERLDLVREAQRFAERVAADSGETVHVAVLEDRDVMYLVRVESKHPVRMVSAVGRRVPAYATGVGKMLLSGLSVDSFNRLYAGQTRLDTLTPNTIDTVSKLREVVADIRRVGIAYDYRESNEDVNCVAAGIRDHTGTMIAAMSISVPLSRWDPERAVHWTNLVREGADELSRSLGSSTVASGTT